MLPNNENVGCIYILPQARKGSLRNRISGNAGGRHQSFFQRDTDYVTSLAHRKPVMRLWQHGIFNKLVVISVFGAVAAFYTTSSRGNIFLFQGGSGRPFGNYVESSPSFLEQKFKARAIERQKEIAKKARQHQFSPFEARSQITSRTYGNNPLIGSFLLKEECCSIFPKIPEQNGTMTTFSSSPDLSFSGIVHYPTLDLRTHVGQEELAVKPKATTEMEEGTPDKKTSPTVGDLDDVVWDYPRAEVTEIILTGLPLNFDKDLAVLTRCGFTNGKEVRNVTTKSADSVIPWETIPQVNQDRALIVNYADGETLLMAVMDGHGDRGHATANFVALDLPRNLASWLHRTLLATFPEPDRADYEEMKKKVKNALIQTFIDLDEHEPVKGNGGTTASVLFKVKRTIFVANVGDSWTVIARYNKRSQTTEVVFQTKHNKPEMNERERMKHYGNTIFEKKNFKGSKESVWMVKYEDDNNHTHEIEMTRSIGDFSWKDHGLLSVPTVDILEMSSLIKSDDEELFAVVVTDGIFENIPIGEVMRHLAESLYRTSKSYRKSGLKVPSPLRACEELIRKSSEMWKTRGIAYRNDMTIGVSKLDF